MNRLPKLIGLIVTATLMSCTSVGRDHTGNEFDGDMVSVWAVDKSGAPPFKRRLVQVPAADIAALEVESGNVETVRKMVTNFRGKPPFRRRTVEVPVVDVSSLEIDTIQKRSIRPRSFFKRVR